MRNKKHRVTPTPTLTLLRFCRILLLKIRTFVGKLFFIKRYGETKKQRQSWCRGFTLVEMVVYVAFFAVLSILAVNSTLIVMKSFYALRLTQSINQSATVALERMSREIRNAYDIDTVQSTFGVNSGRLTLRTKDSLGANTTMEFYVSGSQLFLIEGGVYKGSLMTKNAILTNLVFRQIANPNSRAVKIEMSIRETRGILQKDVNFYNTIILRGSIN